MSFELRSFQACEELFSFILLCQEILDARQQRTQRREELASRRSHASLERMRILSQLAYDPNGRLLWLPAHDSLVCGGFLSRLATCIYEYNGPYNMKKRGRNSVIWILDDEHENR